MIDPSRSAGEFECQKCGARCESAATPCWLCHSKSDGQPAVNPYAPPRLEPPGSQAFGTVVLVVTLIAVVAGLLMMAPGLGVLAAILVAPAILRTALLMRRRERRGKSVGWLQRVLVFAGSLVTVTILVVVVVFAALGTFCLISIGAIQVPRIDPELAILVAAITAVIVVIALVTLTIKVCIEQVNED